MFWQFESIFANPDWWLDQWFPRHWTILFMQFPITFNTQRLCVAKINKHFIIRQKQKWRRAKITGHVPLTSPGTAIVSGPSWYSASVLYISLVAANGATSLAFNVIDFFLSWNQIFIRNPPPMPILCAVVMPLHNIVAIVASTTFPPFPNISLFRNKNYFHFACRQGNMCFKIDNVCGMCSTLI